MSRLEEFCVALHRLRLSQVEQGLAILWYLDHAQARSTTAGELARALRDAGVSTPHSTRLGEALVKSGHALQSADRLRIKPTSRSHMEARVSQILAPAPPSVDQDNGYLPAAVWRDTRTYLERIAAQINGCYEFGFFDGASVLVRRLIETLLIESYEHLKIEEKIKRADGNYPMLSDIIVGAVDHRDLSLGRETKHFLREIKTIGDRAAHNRRYIAVKADLDSIRLGVRVTVDELLHVSGMK